MSQATAQNVVLAVLVVSAAIVGYDNIKKTGKALPSGRTLVAMLMVAAGLTWGAAVAPSVAGPFAILLGVAVALPRVPGATR